MLYLPVPGQCKYLWVSLIGPRADEATEEDSFDGIGRLQYDISIGGATFDEEIHADRPRNKGQVTTFKFHGRGDFVDDGPLTISGVDEMFGR